MTHNIYIYILIMGGISYFIRVLPMTLIRKPLKNQFLQSFLYYVPYVTLAIILTVALSAGAAFLFPIPTEDETSASTKQ